jgi:hypothetical protein
MAGVNLDDLFNDKKPVTTDEEQGVMDVVVTPKAKTKEKTKQETSTSGIYDQLQTLMYSIDISGSMANPIKSDSPSVWDWPQDLKNHIQRQLGYAFGELSEREIELQGMLETATEDQLKEVILGLGPTNYAIYYKLEARNTKMELVKKCVADLVDRRYEKYPDARVVLETFNADATIEAATHESIKTRLAGLYPNGGTNILYAVQQALSYFRQYPSPVGLNHLIIVTDGDDWGAMEVKNLLPEFKEMGVVIDYIYIKGGEPGYSDGSVSAVAKMFTELCKELGGEYTEVTSASEFEKKLLAYSTRLCLPPGIKE